MTSPRRRFPFRFLVALTASAAAIGLSGCVVAAAAVAAAGAVAYVKGELNATIESDVASVSRATDQTIKEMKFFQLSNKQDAVSAEFVMRNAKDERITIKLTKSGDRLTKTQIRVGILGDEVLSRAILDAIKQNL